jgi:hypothetical protein
MLSIMNDLKKEKLNNQNLKQIIFFKLTTTDFIVTNIIKLIRNIV